MVQDNATFILFEVYLVLVMVNGILRLKIKYVTVCDQATAPTYQIHSQAPFVLV